MTSYNEVNEPDWELVDSSAKTQSPDGSEGYSKLTMVKKKKKERKHDPNTLKKVGTTQPWVLNRMQSGREQQAVSQDMSVKRNQNDEELLYGVVTMLTMSDSREPSTHASDWREEGKKNHLVYQLQLILCLQRVVTGKVTTLVYD